MSSSPLPPTLSQAECVCLFFEDPAGRDLEGSPSLPIATGPLSECAGPLGNQHPQCLELQGKKCL